HTLELLTHARNLFLARSESIGLRKCTETGKAECTLKVRRGSEEHCASFSASGFFNEAAFHQAVHCGVDADAANLCDIRAAHRLKVRNDGESLQCTGRQACVTLWADKL